MIKLLATTVALLLLPATALAAPPRASLQSSDRGVRVMVRTDFSSQRIQKAVLRSQGAAVFLRPLAGKRWVSSWRGSPSFVESLSGRRVGLAFRKKEGKWLVWRVVVRGLPKDPPPIPDPQPEGIYISGLEPQWSPRISDYTVTCQEPLSLAVNISEEVALNGQPLSQPFQTILPLEEGEAFTLQGEWGEQYFRCRPEDLPLPVASGQGSGSRYLVTPTLFGEGPLTNYAIVLDERGVPVWWYKAPNPLILDMNMPRPGVFSWVQARNGPGGFSSSDYTLQALDGTFLDSLSPVGFGADHHDLQPTADGGWLFIGYVPRSCPPECIDLSPWGGPAEATAIDSWVQKIDASGNPEWTWKSQDHIDLAESTNWIGALGNGVPLAGDKRGYDIVHMNSVEPDGNGFIFSARHLDAVYRVENPAVSGAIDWKLGGTPRPESLTVLGDIADPLGGQHDARIQEDGTLTVHDNGTGKNRPPRMVYYQIDPLLKTASLLSEIKDKEIEGSFCCGGGRLLSDGWAVSWGGTNLVAEYNFSGERRLALRWPEGKHSYRVVPVDPAELSLADLRQGMDDQLP